MPEMLQARSPWRIGAGLAMGIGSLLITAGAVEGYYDQEPSIEVEAGGEGRFMAASVGEPIVAAELCLLKLLPVEIIEDCEEVPEITTPTIPEVTIPDPDELIEEVEKIIPTTTTPPPTTTTTHPTTTAPPPPPPPPPGGGKVEWMNQAGIAQADQGYVDYIVTDESEWNPGAVSPNRCIGLGQNCPDANGNYWLDDSCPNWRDDPACQLRRFGEYAVGRYGSWREAYEFKRRKGWW